MLCSLPLLLCLPLRAVPSVMIYDIPKVSGITIDGATDDWGARGLRLDYLGQADGSVVAPKTFDARARLGWDERGLLLCVEVVDPSPCENPHEAYLFDKDAVEWFVATGLGLPDNIHAVIAPGTVPEFPHPRLHIYDQRTPALQAVPATLDYAAHKTPTGYVIEARLPWTCLQIAPTVGRELAVQLSVNNSDISDPKKPRRYQAMWYTRPGAFYDTAQMMRVRLAEAPSAPVRAFLAGDFTYVDRLPTGAWVAVSGRADLVGTPVEIRDGDRVLAQGVFTAEQGCARARIPLPLPPRAAPYGPLTAYAAGAPIAQGPLPELESVYRGLFADTPLVCTPAAAFTGEQLPRIDLLHAEAFRRSFGEYAVQVSYYNDRYVPVTRAAHNGRFGAVVEITAPGNLSRTEYLTLCRYPAGWVGVIGTATDFLRTQGVEIEKSPRTFAQLPTQPDAGPLLAAAYANRHGAHIRTRKDVLVQDRTWWYGLKKARHEAPEYALTLPPKYDPHRAQRWPLIVFLHGSGGGETLLANTVQHDPNFPFIILAPRSYREWWVPVNVKLMLDDVLAQYPVDRDRVYLTGLSMGGFGTWAVARDYPEYFAALAPVCGGGDPAWAPALKTLPVWIFHGEDDQSVPIKLGRQMAAALTAAGDKYVKTTFYPHVGHDSWNLAYADPQLYAWLLRQRRGKPAE